MGEAALANNDTFNVDVPPHLAEAFNSGELDQDEMLFQSVSFYSSELSKVNEELTLEKFKQQSYLETIQEKTGHIFSLEQKLKDKVVIEKELHEAKTKLLGFTHADIQLKSLDKLAKDLTDEVANLKERVAHLSPFEAETAKLRKLVDSLQEKNAQSQETVSELKSENRILTNRNNNANSLVDELRNKLEPLQKEVESANQSRAKAYDKLNALQQELNALNESRANDFDVLDNTQKTIDEVISTINLTDKNVKVTSAENKVLSLLLHSIRFTSVHTTKTGHKLIPYLLEEQNVKTPSGKTLKTAVKDTPVFLWVNPNGFACIVSLHKTANNGNADDYSVVMPSLTANGDGRTPEEKEFLRAMTKDICPREEDLQEIADHLSITSSSDIKESFLKAYAQANLMVDKHGGLDSLEGSVSLQAFKNKLERTLDKVSASKSEAKKQKKQYKKRKR